MYYLKDMYIINLNCLSSFHFFDVCYATYSLLVQWNCDFCFQCSVAIKKKLLLSLAVPKIPGKNRTEVGAEVLCSEGMRKTDLDAQEIRIKQRNCMYSEDLACFHVSLIYCDKTPASRWIIEELRRKLPQDDVMCPQSGDTVWNQVVL